MGSCFADNSGLATPAMLEALSLPKMLSGASAFEISDIQEDETDAVPTSGSECNNVTFG